MAYQNRISNDSLNLSFSCASNEVAAVVDKAICHHLSQTPSRGGYGETDVNAVDIEISLEEYRSALQDSLCLQRLLGFGDGQNTRTLISPSCMATTTFVNQVKCSWC